MCIWKSLSLRFHSSCLVNLLFEDKSQWIQIADYTGGHKSNHWDSEKTYKAYEDI